jgi:hypothetical protein
MSVATRIAIQKSNFSVQRKHVEAAYGQRWLDFSAWVRTMDLKGRMLNPFFADLLSPALA